MKKSPKVSLQTKIVSLIIALSFITYWRMDESSKTSQIEAELGGGDTLVNNKSS